MAFLHRRKDSSIRSEWVESQWMAGGSQPLALSL